MAFRSEAIKMETQLLTIEEFAEKMKVARTTIFNWLKSEKLQQGKHYLRIGRVVRFQWPDVLEHLSEESASVEPVLPQPRRVVKRQKGVAINLQYD